MVWWRSTPLRHIPRAKSRVRQKSLPALLFLIWCWHPTALYAENPAACPEDDAAACLHYQHLAVGMDSGDLVVQLASLRAASEELDPALRAAIVGKALKSADLRLRTAGIRYVLASRSNFDVVVEAPVHPTPAQKKVYELYGMLSLRDLKLDEKTDEIKAVVFSYPVKGSIVRGGFELGLTYCRLHMTAGEEEALKGTLHCQYPGAEAADLATSIELD